MDKKLTFVTVFHYILYNNNDDDGEENDDEGYHPSEKKNYSNCVHFIRLSYKYHIRPLSPLIISI